MTTQETSLVSIVIPCYKQAHFLGEAIESVLRQTYKHFEIIVIDDGSPDNTSEVAARYTEVRCVRQENQGLPAARNAGLRESRGEYVVFLDSDDRLLPRALEAGIEAFRLHPESAFVCGHNTCIAFDGGFYDHKQKPCPGASYLALLERNFIELPASVIYRREVVEAAGGFDVTLRSCEDHDLYLRIAREHPIHCHHELVGEYRRHSSSMSQNHTVMLKSILFVLGKQKEFIKGKKEYEEACAVGIDFYRRYYGEGIVNQVREHVRRRSDWRQAAQKINVLLRYYPRGIAENLGRKLRLTATGSEESGSTVKR